MKNEILREHSEWELESLKQEDFYRLLEKNFIRRWWKCTSPYTCTPLLTLHSTINYPAKYLHFFKSWQKTKPLMVTNNWEGGAEDSVSNYQLFG